ncbi:MAG TPA: methyl-accepting chemotaxis protein [Polyangia bacterium]|nr:methyl-accepting chemotaxis protein [Polyangia bacterium]
MPERIVELAKTVGVIANQKVAGIKRINAHAHLLALNAQIESARAGAAGAGFGVVAKEVKTISREIEGLTTELTEQLQPRLVELHQHGQRLVATVRGTRLADLALNLIEIIDRNLYERSCDVRWWATDSAVVAACADPSAQSGEFASRRLGVILDSYTVYADLVVCNLAGEVMAHGRPGKYPQMDHAMLAGMSWFRDALATEDGTGFTVADIAPARELGGQLVATYATAIRERGENKGRPIGVLGIMFDWDTQAQAVVDGVRLSPEERGLTRALIVDAQHRVLAASDRVGVLKEILAVETREHQLGHYETKDGNVIGFALTPGYETYRGLGWFGVLVQKRDRINGAGP